MKIEEFRKSSEWEPLVDALRLELQEYGGLVNLLDEQQRGIMGRDPDNLSGMNEAIQSQIEATNLLRANREQMVGEFAELLSKDRKTKLSELVPYFPLAAQPLIKALIEDSYALVTKIRRRARQNQMLLVRASELTSEVLHTLKPQAFTKSKTYAASGTVSDSNRCSGNCIEATV